MQISTRLVFGGAASSSSRLVGLWLSLWLWENEYHTYAVLPEIEIEIWEID